MKIEKWYRQNATSRRLLAQKSTEKSGNRQRKTKKASHKQLRWREFYRTYWRRKESDPKRMTGMLERTEVKDVVMHVGTSG